jgi:hypothetical protein
MLSAIGVLILMSLLRFLIKLRNEEFRKKMSKKAIIGRIILHFIPVKNEAVSLPLPKRVGLFGEPTFTVHENKQESTENELIVLPVIEKRFNNPKILKTSIEINSGNQRFVYELIAYNFSHEGGSIRGEAKFTKYIPVKVQKGKFVQWFPPRWITFEEIQKNIQWSVKADNGMPYWIKNGGGNYRDNNDSFSVWGEISSELKNIGVSLSSEMLNKCFSPIEAKLLDLQSQAKF